MENPEKIPPENSESRTLIGYTEREEGFYPMYEAGRGFVTTCAFIMCKYCRSPIASMGGPRYDAVCIPCYKKEPDERTN